VKTDDLLSDLLDIHDDHNTQTDRTEIQRAAFGYMGGKNKSIPYLNKYIPVRKKWLDHFCGSCVVTLNRPESEFEMINDRYGGLVNFYRCLQDKKKLKQLLERLDACPGASREEFYYCKNTWCDEVDDVERAAKWFYMIRLSMLGKGQAFGRGTNPPGYYPLPKSLELFWPIHYRLRNVTIENLDFETCFRDFDGISAVHYFDPPYIGTDSGIYVGDAWTRDDLSRLLKCCEKAEGFVALSGYADEQIDSCKFWTNRITWEVAIMAEPHAFSETNYKAEMKDIKEGKGRAKEVLWVKD